MKYEYREICTTAEIEAEYCERWSIMLAKSGNRQAADRWLALALFERWLALFD